MYLNLNPNRTLRFYRKWLKKLEKERVMPIELPEVLQMGIQMVMRAEKAEKQVKDLTEQLRKAETALHEATNKLQELKDGNT